MFENYLKTACRHLLRHKVFSCINIAGLAVGMACTMLILLWVQDELSYDRFHKNVSDVYRVIHYREDSHQRTAGTPAPLGPALKEEIQEVSHFARIASATPHVVVQYGGKMFYENRIVFADPALFDVFTFPFVKGNPSNALSGLSNVVITEEIAQKYFGTDDPIGKVLSVEAADNVVVSGVIKNIPNQSHIQFDFVLPFDNVIAYHILGTEWGDFNFTTFIQLRPNAFYAGLQKRMTDVSRAHGCPQVLYGKWECSLQPMTDVHLDADVEPIGVEVMVEPGDRNTVIMFSLVALLILAIACINFMNLSTAQCDARRKEVSMRKALGAERRQLVGQFLGESVVLAICASIIAVILIEVCLPGFNRLTAKHLSPAFTDGWLILDLIMMTILTGLVAGWYPAVYLSSFHPMALLKKRVPVMSSSRLGSRLGLRGVSFRTCLVVAQFSLSIGLIICTLVVSQQLRYMKSKNLGFDKDNFLVLPIKESFGSKYEMIKQRLLQEPAIRGVTAQEWFQIRGPRNTGGRAYDWEGNPDPLHSPWLSHTRVDFGFIELMGIRMLEGRAFSKDHPSDANEAFILNEEAVRVMELKSPVGKYFRLYGQEGKIIGVMQNACFSSLHQKVEPLVYHVLTDARNAQYGAMLIKMQGRSTVEGIAGIANVWKTENPQSPFEYQFLDEAMNSRYSADSRTGSIFSWFACLAIFISCLGLFGLASFAAEQRTKEIGIRKVLGSSVGSIVILLSKEFTSLVIIANLIAWPIAWYAMNAWLQKFAYRVDMSCWVCVLAGGIALGIALLTVSTRAIRAATANPVEALRYE